MAQKPTKSSGLKTLNIMELLRGNIDLKSAPEPTSQTVAYGSPELISRAERSKILQGGFRAVDNYQRVPITAGSLMTMVQSSLTNAGSDRLENKKILDLMPEVSKAVRLMVASILSPNDLSRHDIKVIFTEDDIGKEHAERLSDAATKFFQKQLKLKTELPKWIREFGYETGASVFAVIPLRSFEKVQDESYVGVESFIEKVVDPLCHQSLFGFGDTLSTANDLKHEILGLESFASSILLKEDTDEKSVFNKNIPEGLSKALIEKMIGQEALNLTDNPGVLQVKQNTKDKRSKKTAETLRNRYRYKAPSVDTMVSVSAERDQDGKSNVVGNPILMHLPPESVTVIHTPGDPTDHQGYLILLDQTGSPINAVAMQAAQSTHASQQTNDIFSQTYNAYGIGSSGQSSTNQDTMNRIYTQIISKHIEQRLGKAGYSHFETSNIDSTFRCMFGRFMQQKQTRILFLPKELVTYMTFEYNEGGYGVSRLDGIKFNLGMKMAVQVSRVLAAIKAATDKRKIEMKFTENMMEQPESIYNSIVREYVNKQSFNFSIDPNTIQNQIADKSISIKGVGIPGLEDFDISNEPDSRGGTIDFDPGMLEYIDKGIVNGLGVPPSAMNSLGEDEYAKSVATTNIFFSMDISIDQDTTISHTSDLIQKYARYSEEFEQEMYKVCPALRKDKKSNSSTDEAQDKVNDKDEDKGITIPEHYDLDQLIDQMQISLPKPNVAPNKAQFESLDAMIASITTIVSALFPDDLAGTDDTLRPVIAMLRAKLITSNIRTYLASSGISGIEVPDAAFSAEMGETAKMLGALQNLREMLGDQTKVTAQPEAIPPGPAGY